MGARLAVTFHQAASSIIKPSTESEQLVVEAVDVIAGDTQWDEWTPRARALQARATALRDLGAGLTQLQAAADLEEKTLPPCGPVDGVTACERLGELLLANGRAPAALAAFRRTLELHPRRGRALFWAARAAAAAHDPAALGYWRELADVWAHADADWPGVTELRREVAIAR